MLSRIFAGIIVFCLLLPVVLLCREIGKKLPE